MNKKELEQRTKGFALRIIAFVSRLPRGRICDVLGYQLLKAGTSVGGNYREANHAQSRKDFIHKIAIVEKESSESEYGYNFSTSLISAKSTNGNGYLPRLVNFWLSSLALAKARSNRLAACRAEL